jgi:hypothetical protein
MQNLTYSTSLHSLDVQPSTYFFGCPTLRLYLLFPVRMHARPLIIASTDRPHSKSSQSPCPATCPIPVAVVISSIYAAPAPLCMRLLSVKSQFHFFNPNDSILPSFRLGTRPIPSPSFFAAFDILNLLQDFRLRQPRRNKLF